MRYAVVYKSSEEHTWVTETWGNGRGVERHHFPTHRQALDAALVAVGLAKPAEHREAP